MIQIGLTGNIASGKSMVENIILSQGYKVIDLDIISHELLKSTCKDKIIEAFNTIDRLELSKIVFKDKYELKKLENIIHPELKKYVLNYFEENKDEKAVFISGALIYEAKFNNLFDKIIYIDAKKDIRLKRLILRNNFTKEQALLRIEAQSDNNKTKADFIIENNEDKETLEKNVSEVLKKIL